MNPGAEACGFGQSQVLISLNKVARGENAVFAVLQVCVGSAKEEGRRSGDSPGGSVKMLLEKFVDGQESLTGPMGDVHKFSADDDAKRHQYLPKTLHALFRQTRVTLLIKSVGVGDNQN